MADTRDFLLEIGCEEMPSAPLMNAARQLGPLVSKGLDEAGLGHGGVRVVSSPRRLAALVEGVATSTREVHDVRRGPAASIAFDASGAPTKAALGFARKCGVDPASLERRLEADGREYVFAEKSVPAAPAAPILSRLSHDVIAGLQWPNYRSQRWGSEHETFVRPIRWIVALLGDEVVPVRYADVTSGNVTRGHRVLSPGDHVVPEPSRYLDVLHAAHVLDAPERAQAIREGIARVEGRLGVRVDTPKGTFDEVVNLCEWPSVLVGRFDEEFLKVPREIICESMLSNQRYFPCYDADGSLTRDFIVVSNGAASCAGTIVDGNERVVRARLDDAKFFYEEDLKVPLETFCERLSTVVFQERLGTVAQKARRMEGLAAAVAEQAGADARTQGLAERAAHLAKADLVSQAVVEFTNQQGVMGGYYAAAAGEDPEVCAAIRDHYRPRFSGDSLPEGLVGTCVAIADKLDTVCGIFAIDEPPTGSSDPYAVRRAAIGVIAMLQALPHGVSLVSLCALALGAYRDQGIAFDPEETSAAVSRFFQGRLAAIARDEGVRPDTIEAVSATGCIEPAEFLARAHALEEARANEGELFDDLATAYARAAHLADPSLGTKVDEALLGPSERALLAACDRGEAEVRSALEALDFPGALASLAALRAPIDRFFTDVLVMDDDDAIRRNRLALLNRFVAVFAGVADMGALSRKK